MGSRRGSARLLFVAALAIATVAHGDPLEPLPGPAPQIRAQGYDAATANVACEGCHTSIASEWRASLHHRAWDDPMFLTAYAIEPTAFCRGCHAPEADPTHLPTEGARRLGVGCVTCHTQDSAVVGSHPAPTPSGVHAVVADARLATSSACERCHQFEFPTPQHAPMQGTMNEHRASPRAAETCQSCHMPMVTTEGSKPHRSHDFRVLGDVAKLRSAIAARASRTDDHAVTVTLSTGHIGHAFPTGDMFRRLELRVRAVDNHGRPAILASPVVLARRFVFQEAERLQTGDDRLPASGEARAIRVSFAEPIGARSVVWEVAYQRLDEGMARAFGVDPHADEVIVAEGTLPAEKSRK